MVLDAVSLIGGSYRDLWRCLKLYLTGDHECTLLASLDQWRVLSWENNPS